MSAPATLVDGTRRPALTPVVVRLKLALLRNGLRQSAGRRAAYILSLVVVFTLLQLIGLIALRGTAHADAVCIPFVAVLALGWAVMPLLFPSRDETLDPTLLTWAGLRLAAPQAAKRLPEILTAVSKG